MSPLVIALLVSVAISLIGTGGALLSNYLDLHGHKQAASVLRSVNAALIKGIQDVQHPETQDAVAQRAEFAGVIDHPSIQQAINGS